MAITGKQPGDQGQLSNMLEYILLMKMWVWELSPAHDKEWCCPWWAWSYCWAYLSSKWMSGQRFHDPPQTSPQKSIQNFGMHVLWHNRNQNLIHIQSAPSCGTGWDYSHQRQIDKCSWWTQLWWYLTISSHTMKTTLNGVAGFKQLIYTWHKTTRKVKIFVLVQLVIPIKVKDILQNSQ